MTEPKPQHTPELWSAGYILDCNDEFTKARAILNVDECVVMGVSVWGGDTHMRDVLVDRIVANHNDLAGINPEAVPELVAIAQKLIGIRNSSGLEGFNTLPAYHLAADQARALLAKAKVEAKGISNCERID